MQVCRKICADKISVTQLYQNLISNAIKYASAGKQIDFTARIDDEQVVICVIDHGETIAEVDRQLIFKRTAQLAEGKSRGRGLGLAIVKKIASSHGGKCWVEPNQPQGNAFCVSLPLM